MSAPAETVGAPAADVEKPVVEEEKPAETVGAPAADVEKAVVEEEKPAEDAPPDSDKRDIKDRALSWPEAIGLSTAALFFFWVFLTGLTLMGSAFKVLGGAGAANLFAAINNPISGVMIGVLATVFVQSSSTSTSVVVAMVSADLLTVKVAIPIIMGANIGTTVTNTIVSMGFVGNQLDLHRAFSAATVHDMFNFLAVFTFLPIEVIIGEIQGTGGPLYWLTDAISEAALGGQSADQLFTSPVKIITAPVADAICKSNKYVIYGRTLPAPKVFSIKDSGASTCQTCNPINGVTHNSSCVFPPDEEDGRRLSAGEAYTRALLSKRRLEEDDEEPAEPIDCKEYSCVQSDLAKNFAKGAKKAYAKIHSCEDYLTDFSCPGKKDHCYLEGAQFHQDNIVNGALVSGGFLKGAGDVGAGIIGVIISLLLLSGGMLGLTKCLTKIFLTKAKAIIALAMMMNDYIGILVGLGITIIVQSSSVTTTALTPLAAIGVLPLNKMYPMTLGANIGTTTTALLASLVSLKKQGVQIALCHFFFNVFGIMVFFPAPFMRGIPLLGARTLGVYCCRYKWAPLAYICLCFLVIPAVAFGVVETFNASIAGGVVLTLIVVAASAAFGVAWCIGIPRGNALCYKVLSKEDREKFERELLEDNARIGGITPEEYKLKTTLKWSGM
jgi:sodium-dependent phosphate cotransporter